MAIILIKTQNTKDILEANKNNRFCGVGLQKHEIKISSVISQKHKLNPSRKLSTIFTPIRIDEEVHERTWFDELVENLASFFE